MVYLEDGFDTMREMFLGEEVKIFPGDTDSKCGIIKDINPAGVTFLVTKSRSDSYVVGQLRFVSFHNLTFEKI